MKRIHAINNMSSNTRESAFSEKLFINGHLNEQLIIDLHQLFLQCDWSSLCVDSLEQGRALIYTCLDSLRCYHNPACITRETSQLRSSVTDLAHYLELATTSSRQETIRDLFLTHLEYDFIWIEQSKKLESEIWFKLLKNSIKELNLSEHIPIITVYTDR